MERDNGGVSSEGVLIPVPDSSELFEKSVLAPLQSSYLYEESRHFFKYQSAVLVNNPSLQEKYNAFREKRQQEGYSAEDLKESYGFLLFDDYNKAISLARTGVVTGNSTCTTLGDPSKGVYISMYSDCLDSNCCYHVKSGHIAIIRLTKGRVKKVGEIYTQNFTPPTEGFDCHVSEQLPSVSSETSSFLAFERTQYYIYELLNDGSNETSQSPCAACPFAIVSFSYSDSKAKLVEPQQKSDVKKIACPYLPWRGKVQLGTEFYSVGLRSMTEASMPTKLPAVVKINRAISMADLRHLLPKAVFETCITGEAFLDGLYCSLFEFFSSENEESKSLTLLVDEIQKNEAALIVSLNDGGFLILLHSSHFLGYDEMGCGSTDSLRGIFVFPDSRAAVRDVKFAHKPSAKSPDKLWFLPALRPAEDKVREPAIDSGEQLWDRLVQFMQNYKAPLSPGLESSPSREARVFHDQYDEQESHKHLDSPPKWNEVPCQRLKSYLRKPDSFQLPLSEASQILAVEEEQQREDLDDDVYICLSSPEMESPVSNVLKGHGSDETRVETLVNFVPKAETQNDSQPEPENIVGDDLQPGYAAEDNTQRAAHTELEETDVAEEQTQLIALTDDLRSELIVSITSAEQTVTVDSLRVDRNAATTKHDGFELGGISMSAKLQILQKKSHSDKPAEVRKVVTRPEVIKLIKTKKRKRRRGRYKKQTQGPLARAGTPRSQTGNPPDKIDDFNNHQVKPTIEACGEPPQNVPDKAGQRRDKRVERGEKAPDPEQQSVENSVLTELKAGPLRKKTELWDLKPVVSECGRILVPHGSLDIAYHMKRIQKSIQATKDDLNLDMPMSDPSATIHHTVEKEQMSWTGQETSVDEMDITKCMDGTDHQQNIHCDANPEENILGHLDNSSEAVVESLKKSTDSPPPALLEKQMDPIYCGKSSRKDKILLRKLKSVLRRRKQKTDFFMTREATENRGRNTVTCHKKPRVETKTELVPGNSGSPPVDRRSVDTIPSMLPVDVFAFALGLTPKETRVKRQTTREQKNVLYDDSPATQEKPYSDKQHQILRQPLSIYPQRRRIKTLKKLQGISEECIKQKWWLHFQSPTCNGSETLTYNGRSRYNLLRKTVKENVNSDCASADGLNLLADLALGANSCQVPPPEHPELQRASKTSLKMCELPKPVPSVDQESLLHALLRQPAAKTSHPPKASTSLGHTVGGSPSVKLLTEEHAYSLAPSSSLPLGLPGPPFQASPLSGSTRLLLHHQAEFSDAIKAPQSLFGQEDQREATDSPQCLKKLLTSRQAFRRSRVFNQKDGSLQVTRQWTEKYNFEPDSRFTSEMKSKAISRALHGPWDFTIRDSEVELRLIVHMWIGLFYSRSTARFFHVDSNFTHPCSEGFLDIPSPVKSDPAVDNTNAGTSEDASEPSIPDALDLSQKCITASDKDSVILDLPLKNSIIQASEPQVSKKETSVLNEPEVTQTPNESNPPEEPKESQPESTEQNNGFCKSIIPFIGPDISEVQDSLLQSNDEDVVKEKERIPFIDENSNSEATLPTAVFGTSEISVEHQDPSLPVVPLHEPSEPCLPENGGNRPDSRSPTPTVDEMPCEYIPLGSKNSNEILKNICETSSSSNDESPEEGDQCSTPALSTHHGGHRRLSADHGVLQSVKDFLSKSGRTDEPRQNKCIDMNECADRTAGSRNSLVHCVGVFNESNMTKEEKPATGSATQGLQTQSSDSEPSFKINKEQILGVKLQVKKADSPVPPLTNDELETSASLDFCHSDASLPLTEWSQENKSHVNEEIKQSPCNSQHEPRPRPQHPVTAVKPTKRNQSQEECLRHELYVEESSPTILTSTPVATYTNPTPALPENTEKKPSIRKSKTLNENHRANGLSSTDSSPIDGPSISSSEATALAHPEPAFFYQGDDHPNVNRTAASFSSGTPCESAKGSPNSVEDFERRTKETTDLKQAECSDASAQHKNNGVVDDRLAQSPTTSLVCKILNPKDTTAVSFLEQVSKRCLQVDPTQASIEQACLIFSEKMKQLVKKNKRNPTRQDDAFDDLRPSCSTSVTVHFSNLDEQDVSMCPLSTSSFGQTIKVDMSHRKEAHGQHSRRPQETSAGNPAENAGVSHVSAECTRLYEEAMDGICAAQMDLPRPKRFKMDGGHRKTGQSHCFDFCGQMKREMDETFRTKLNSLVKKSCKTRHRFFMLLTSEDKFFEDTRAQLEREGHTAVDPEEFFRDSLSSLLIVLKNEDIAEHIFQVPHLLELKRSPNVLFAGIDEPDDVINLTHQEIFTAGGIVMFDKAALESLSLCNMKRVSTKLQELSGTGKWKWMLHYRDSRGIKENARLSEEAKEKKNFLLWGQDAGLLEVMPYHECDLLSREQPDYLTCLIRLQIQNISSRHTLFITDNAADGAYERKGISTTTMSSFLSQSLPETFPV